jgi:DNA-binding GntR family transcriptional regulator
MASAEPQRRVRLSDQAYLALRGMIVRGALAPGSQIVEPRLAEELGISRTPLREALLRLAEEGLVDVFPQSGSYVAPIRVEAVTEAQFVREHLECALIREAAERVDPRALAELHRNLAQQDEAQRRHDADAFYELDEALHAAFAECAGRPGVWRLIQQSKLHMDRVRLLSLPIAHQIPLLVEQHRAIVQAVARRDPDAAETALRRHLREVFATIAELGLNAAEEPPLRRRRGI